jgi:hypothetical protein
MARKKAQSCANCGEPLAKDAKFCKECGTSVGADAEPQARSAAQLTGPQVVALIELAQAEVSPLSPLGPLIGSRRKKRPDVGDVGPDVVAAVKALADPYRQVRVTVAAASESLTAYYYAGPGVDGLVGASVFEDRLELTTVWSPGDLAALSGATLLADALPRAEPLSIGMTVSGLTALAGAIDAVNQSHLEGLLARDPAPLGPFDTGAVETQVELGSSVADARWAVTMLGILSPPIARPTPEDVSAGMDELVRAGLVETRNEEWYPSAELARLATHWRPPLPAIAHEVVTRRDGGVDYRYQIAVRGRGPLYALDYGVTPDGEPRVHLRGIEGLEWLEGISALLTDR